MKVYDQTFQARPDCVERERERERVPGGWPTEWVDDGGRTKLLRERERERERERVLGAGRMGKEGGALRLGLGFFLVFIYIYIMWVG